MTTPTPIFSIRDAVGEALRYVRENWRFVFGVAGVGALGTVIVVSIGMAAPPLSLLSVLGSGLVQTFVYAALVGGALFGAAVVRGRVGGDGARLWAALVIVGFFLVLVIFVVTIPVMMALSAGPLAPYAEELQRAGSDQAAVMQIMTRFAEQNPGPLLLVMLFYSSVWLYLTSRLYLAAPATVDNQRILTFETWGWTKGHTLRIIAARLMLLLPANILVQAVSYLIGRLLGLDTMGLGATTAEAARANVGGFLTYVLVAGFLSFALFAALEAGLSSAIYKNLKREVRRPAA